MSINKQPLVSIITPCYNVEKYIADYLDSVIAQTYDNIELILIDDGSTDDTKEIIDSYVTKISKRGYKFQYIYQENCGQASALNKGLAIFNGNYFTWPDADDILSRDNIIVKVLFLQNNPDYSLVRGKRKFFKKDINKSYDRDNEIDFQNENIFFDLILEKTFPSGGCYLMKRELFLKCYPDRKIYQNSEGQNWQLLVPATSWSKCGSIDKVIFYIRELPNSHSRKQRNLYEWLIRFDGLQNILFDSFLHSNCDIKYCKNIVKERFVRKKLEIAFNYFNKKIVNQQYEVLKNMGKLRKKDTIKYIAIQNTFFYYVFTKTRKFGKYFYKLIR